MGKCTNRCCSNVLWLKLYEQMVSVAALWCREGGATLLSTGSHKSCVGCRQSRTWTSVHVAFSATAEHLVFALVLSACIVYWIFAVLFDITGVMFNKRFMDEVFKPQEVYPKKSLRAILERFAHSSVMRLNPASMDKVLQWSLLSFEISVELKIYKKKT